MSSMEPVPAVPENVVPAEPAGMLTRDGLESMYIEKARAGNADWAPIVVAGNSTRYNLPAGAIPNSEERIVGIVLARYSR